MTITLPHALEAKLQHAAAARDLSVEELALDILGHAIDLQRPPSPEEVVAEIRAMPSVDLRPKSGSLAEALRKATEDPDFELESWRRDWAAAEAEMKAVSRANDLAEGRG